MTACHNTVVEYVFYGLINPGADCTTMMISSKHRDNRPIIVHQSSYLSLHQSYWCLLMPTSVILETNTVRWSVALINSAETVSTLCPFICLLTPNSESHSSVSALEVGIWLDMLCTGLSCASVCSVSVCFHACRGVIALYRDYHSCTFFLKDNISSHTFSD